MNDMRDDDLSAAFAELRRVESGPSFAALTEIGSLEAARRRHRRDRATVVAIAAIIVVAGIAVRARSEPEIDFERFSALTGLDPANATWQAPSDFLLDTPGRQFLRSVPQIEVQVPQPSPDSIRSTDSHVTPRRRSDS